MKSSPYWIDAGPARRIAILARPRGGDWLPDEIAAWKNAGISMVVSLLAPEKFQNSISKMKQSCAAMQDLNSCLFR